MPETIIIDPGHGGFDSGAVFGDRREADDNLRLALAVGDILERAGYPVVYTRTSDIYSTPIEKAVIGNNAGGDVFVSFHRNSTSEAQSSASGVETLVYSDQGLPARLARSINKQLSDIGFADRGVVERPGLVVLRRTKIPAILIETGFINNPSDNALFDEKFAEIAAAIADGIMLALGGAKEEDDPLYRVQVGAYARRVNAERMAEQLTDAGFPAAVVLQDGLYKVQAGSFRELSNAVRLEQKLRAAGYPTYIVKVLA